MTPHSVNTRKYCIDALSRYWPVNPGAVEELPIPFVSCGAEPETPQFTITPLPHWAADLGHDGGLLVPRNYIQNGDGAPHLRVDWFGVIFWYLNCVAERAFENRSGPIHSYSLRLAGWDGRMWEKAWVNRVALFLRRWAAKERGVGEERLFGALPKTEIILTHDVDAVRKTLAIRLKQSAFHAFNATRCAVGGDFGEASARLRKFARFLTSADDYWMFDELTALEEKWGARSQFLFYGGGAPSGVKKSLLDPAYDVNSPNIRVFARRLLNSGCAVGLHPSFDSWDKPEVIAREKQAVERAVETEVAFCRQHWLRFSWDKTWKAQEEAGIRADYTLGFNNRPAFRNGAALKFHPWDHDAAAARAIESVPMVLMDSHFYDYMIFSDTGRESEIKRWLDEIRFVNGVATINWHPHTLSRDYGWRNGYETALRLIYGG